MRNRTVQIFSMIHNQMLKFKLYILINILFQTISEAEIAQTEILIENLEKTDATLSKIEGLLDNQNRRRREEVTDILDGEICAKVLEWMLKAAGLTDVIEKLSYLLKVVEGLERGVNCAAIKDEMVSIVSTEKKKVAVEKVKAKAKLPPPTTTKAPTTSTPAVTTTLADFTLEPTSTSTAQELTSTIAVTTKKPTKY